MRIETTIRGSVLEARLSDNMSFADHSAFRALLSEISKTGARSCIFDLSGLNSIDSAGLGMFMIAREEAQKSGWTITLRSPKGHVKSLMELGKFDKLLTIEP